MSDYYKEKQLAAEHAVKFIEPGMVVGLGTGSTAAYAIQKIGERVAGGLAIKGVATSLATERLARQAGIPLLGNFKCVDITIDGADEVDGRGYLIKGGGGALTREKIVAAASGREIIVVDESKQVQTLGQFPLPVEVLPFGYLTVIAAIEQMGCSVKLRMNGQDTFLTDNGNYIIDCRFEQIDDPDTLVFELNGIPGVVENGLFVGLCDLLLVGGKSGQVQEIPFS